MEIPLIQDYLMHEKKSKDLPGIIISNWTWPVKKGKSWQMRVIALIQNQ